VGGTIYAASPPASHFTVPFPITSLLVLGCCTDASLSGLMAGSQRGRVLLITSPVVLVRESVSSWAMSESGLCWRCPA